MCRCRYVVYDDTFCEQCMPFDLNAKLNNMEKRESHKYNSIHKMHNSNDVTVFKSAYRTAREYIAIIT